LADVVTKASQHSTQVEIECDFGWAGILFVPHLPVGHYDLTIPAAGFKTLRTTNLTIDTDAALKIDAVLQIGQRSETVTVEATAAATGAQVATVASHLGSSLPVRR
jgi:hypothetical protein